MLELTLSKKSNSLEVIEDAIKAPELSLTATLFASMVIEPPPPELLELSANKATLETSKTPKFHTIKLA